MGQIFQQWDAPLMQSSSLSFASIANQTEDICVPRPDDSALFPFRTTVRTSFYNSSAGPPGGLIRPLSMTLGDMKGILQKTLSSVRNGWNIICVFCRCLQIFVKKAVTKSIHYKGGLVHCSNMFVCSGILLALIYSGIRK